MKTKKIILPESQMPTQWYNIVGDMTNRPLPPLNPTTKGPVTLEQLSTIFAEELIAYSGGYPFSISGDIRSVPS